MTEKDVMAAVQQLEAKTNQTIADLERRVKQLEETVAFHDKDVDRLLNRDIAA